MADTAPTFGWICTDPWLLVMAEAMLDEEYEDPSVKPGHTNVYRLGRIGSINVVINYLPEPPRAADAAHIAQNMATSFSGIKAILITGFAGWFPSTGIRSGDLVISPATNQYDSDSESSSTPTPNIVQRAVYVLQREVGADGHWLSSNLSLAAPNFPDLPQFAQRPSSGPPDYPQLHYGNIGSGSKDIQNGQLQDRLAAVRNIICVDSVAAGIRAGTFME
jgi:nucleoside phosphorylase